MDKPYLLHMLTPGKNVSPFDVNMAYDAGWNAAIPYNNVALEEVSVLVQDTIFSRGPRGVKRTGIFLGGRDLHLAMDMLGAAKTAMVPPFEVSVFADPSGAFTTAAGMVAIVERRLAIVHNTTLQDKSVLALGGTGPVGAAAAVLAAKAGAKVIILSRKIDRAEHMAEICNHRYGSDLTGIKADVNDHLDELLTRAEVVLASAKAGVQVLNREQIEAAKKLLVAADVNAVPPSGIAGVDMQADGASISGSKSGTIGIGALAIGNVKYQAQHHLLKLMRETEKPLYLHFEHAFEFARDYVQQN